MLSPFCGARRALAILFAAIVFAAVCDDSRVRGEDSTASAVSASALQVWRFRGITPGATADRSVLAEKMWGEPFDRAKLPSGEETWHYPLEGHEAILVIHNHVVQVVELMLRKGTELKEVLSAFKLKEARQAGVLPPAARQGSPIPADWEATQIEGARVVIFVDPKQPGTIARLMRFYGPDPPPPKSITNSVGMKLKLIPAGSFRMGSPEPGAELEADFRVVQGRFSDEQPQHEVRLSRPFYMAIHEVTVGQFRQFIQETGHKMKSQSAAAGRLSDKAEFAGGTWEKPGFPQSDSHPVVSVSWEDSVAFCSWLSKKECREYRLPTEAEWEYACRAGTTTHYYQGDDPQSLVNVANVLDLAAKSRYPSWTSALSANDGHTHTSPVGSFQPNSFGLYDMHGNAWEWCQDWYDPEYYRKSPADDPPGAKTGNRRIYRGGCWY